MNCKHLPEGYTLHRTVDLAQNRRLFLLVNGACLLIMILLELPLFVGGVSFSSFDISPFGMLTFLAAIAASLAVHELIHGLFFYIFSREKITYGLTLSYAYAGNPNYYFGRNSYLIIGLAPAVLLNAVLLLGVAFTSGGLSMIFYQLFVVHFAGCVGDFYISALLLLKYPVDTLIRDSGVSMEFYTQAP